MPFRLPYKINLQNVLHEIRLLPVMHKLRLMRARNFNYPPVLFLHIQKTAGSALKNFLELYYRGRLISHADYVGKHPDQLKNIPFVSGHFGYDYARSLMATRYSFTFLRDPRERILSYYYFCRAKDPGVYMAFELAHKLNLESFLEEGLKAGPLKSRIWNNQTWQLAHGYGYTDKQRLEDFAPEDLIELAISHLDDFSFIGLTETFTPDCNKIISALNIPVPGKLAIANSNINRLHVNDISPYAQQLLDKLTHLDQRLYDEVVKRRRNPENRGDTENRNV